MNVSGMLHIIVTHNGEARAVRIHVDEAGSVDELLARIDAVLSGRAA